MRDTHGIQVTQHIGTCYFALMDGKGRKIHTGERKCMSKKGKGRKGGRGGEGRGIEGGGNNGKDGKRGKGASSKTRKQKKREVEMMEKWAGRKYHYHDNTTST